MSTPEDTPSPTTSAHTHTHPHTHTTPLLYFKQLQLVCSQASSSPAGFHPQIRLSIMSAKPSLKPTSFPQKSLVAPPLCSHSICSRKWLQHLPCIVIMCSSVWLPLLNCEWATWNSSESYWCQYLISDSVKTHRSSSVSVEWMNEW